MRIEITQLLSEDYFKEYYSEWLSFRSKYKKWEHIIGFTSIGIAFVICIIDRSLDFISTGLLFFGLFMIFEFYNARRMWLKERMESKMINEKVTMVFEEEVIHSIGPFTEMNAKWSFITQALETEKGLILIPENGISIYLQKKSFKDPSDIVQILKKIKEN